MWFILLFCCFFDLAYSRFQNESDVKFYRNFDATNAMFDFLPIKLRMHLGDMCAHISVGKNPAERKTILDQPGCARLLQVYNRGAKIS